MVDWTAIVVALIAILGSAGVWSLIDHKQQRKFEKEMHDSEVLKEIKATRADLTALRQIVDENEAKASRIRILKFADEIFMDIRLITSQIVIKPSAMTWHSFVLPRSRKITSIMTPIRKRY